MADSQSSGGYPTADIMDDIPDAQVLEPMMKSYGGKLVFGGKIRTLKVHEDNTKVRTLLESPGNGCVLVVDGGGSMRCALVGDNLGDLGVKNGWNGIVVYGCIRDSAVIATQSIGVQALGTNPRKSVKRNIGEVDIPVTFGGVTFIPGQHVYCDHDGVVVLKEPFTKAKL